MLDELRWLVPEVELYGASAESLEGSVQVTIMGGFDRSAHQTLSQQAGHTSVTSVSVGGGMLTGAHYTDSEQWREVITAADQQQLKDGESVIRIAGMPLMYGYTPSYRDNRKLRKQIEAEVDEVRTTVQGAREEQQQISRAAAAKAHREYHSNKKSRKETSQW